MKEEEIRPQDIFDEYLRLARLDVAKYFSDVPLAPVLCPACGLAGALAFVKDGFAYEECPECMTLFVSPRPEEAAFSRYYREAASAQYWATTFYKVTEAARREKIWKPKARQAWELIQERCSDVECVIDIGGGYGVFAEELSILAASSVRVVVVEPSPFLADVCRQKGLEVIEKFLDDVLPSDLPRGRKCFTSFELFEHLHTPRAFLQSLDRHMKVGDMLLLTTLSGLGVDIRVLWEASKSVAPPHHLNFFNPRSFASLVGAIGWSDCRVTTPGKLDVDIMVNNMAHVTDRFWRAFLTSASDSQKAEMQDCLARQGWSSHMMAVCIK